MSRAERAAAEAADWLIARADGPLSPEGQAAFDAWLGASDGNKAAYWRLEFGWDEADRIGALGPVSGDAPAEAHDRRARRWWLPAAIAASIVLAFGTHRLAFESSPTGSARPAASADGAERSYTTVLGGKRLVGLADGSRIQLNTLSKLRTEITAARREVWLDQGEAFFEVAHREGHPFIVHAGDRQITVLGTKFAVRRDGDKIIVTVQEGRVQLDELKDNRPLRSSIIVGGDIAMADGPATLVTARSPEAVADELSWREGMLTFDQETLPSIAAEFNRYNEKKLVLDSASADAIRITGTFPSNKPAAFARLLRDAYGLQIADTEDEIRVTR